MCFDPVAAVCIITTCKGYTIMTLFLRILYLYLFDSIFFSGTVWIAKLHFFQEGICFPDKGCHRNREKNNFSVIIATVPTTKNG